MKYFVVSFLLICIAGTNKAQTNFSENRSCSVVCLDDQWIPESYDMDAKCTIKYSSEGVLSVHETNDVANREDYNREDFIPFKLAIHSKRFDTIFLFSDQSFTSVNASKVLARCEKGDEIIIILHDSGKYSLPHHRITVI